MKYLNNLIISSLLFVSPCLLGQGLVINEIMADNDITIQDEFGEYSDWIELYNPGDMPLNAGDYYLSDDPGELQEWLLPDTVLGPGAFLLVFASDMDTLHHTNFKISSSGEAIFLFDADGNLVQETDSVPLGGDRSYGRVTDGAEEWKVFHFPSPGTSNNVGDELSFSHKRGFYTSPFQLEIQSARAMEIRYTLDGSPPTSEDRLYEGPLHMGTREGDPDVFSMVPTTHPPPTDCIKNWEAPEAPSKKANLVRCRSFNGTEPVSPIYSATYFVDSEGADRYTMPVFSLATDSLNLFSFDSGIYVPGIHGVEVDRRSGNFFQRGVEWERDVHIEYFENDGDVGFAQDGGVRIHGGFSRRAATKSLRLYARNEYGKKYFEYPLFSQREYSDFKRIILRGAITTFQSKFGDAFITNELVPHLNFETQAYEPVMLFLNGEYWGVYNMKEFLDGNYMHSLYPEVHEDSVNIMAVKGDPREGNDEAYVHLMNYIKANSLAEQEHFSYVLDRIDYTSFVDFYATEIYMANKDILNNTIFWNSQSVGSKIRWILTDLDASFKEPDKDMIDFLTAAKDEPWPSRPWPSFFFRGMIQNEGCRKDMICRILDLMQNELHADRVMAFKEPFKFKYLPEMEEHILRWNYPSSKETWTNYYDSVMVRFANTRPIYLMEHMEKGFGLDQEELANLCDCYDPEEFLDVEFSYPLPEDTCASPFELNAEANVLSGGAGVRMSLFLDGKYVETDYDAPYEWNKAADSAFSALLPGSYELEVFAYDAVNNTTDRAHTMFTVARFYSVGDIFELGDSSHVDGTADLLTSNMVINETDSFSNQTADTMFLQVDEFSFYARAEADPLTPFIVRVNGDDDFTVLAIGDSREKDDYELGENHFPFRDDSDTVLAIAPGETIATGFLDAFADGSGGGKGSVIPYDEAEPSDEIWYAGSDNDLSFRVEEGGPPVSGVAPMDSVRRNYHYNIAFTVRSSMPVNTVGMREWTMPELSIYPNPVSGGDISILLSKSEGALKLSITDMQGRILYSQQSEEKLIRISSDLLPGAGTYLVRIESGQGVAYGKLIKAK